MKYITVDGTPWVLSGREIKLLVRSVPKVPSNPRHELGDIQVVYPEFLDTGQCRKLT